MQGVVVHGGTNVSQWCVLDNDTEGGQLSDCKSEPLRKCVFKASHLPSFCRCGQRLFTVVKPEFQCPVQ